MNTEYVEFLKGTKKGLEIELNLLAEQQEIITKLIKKNHDKQSEINSKILDELSK